MHCLKLMHGFFTFISQGKERGAKAEKAPSSISVLFIKGDDTEACPRAGSHVCWLLLLLGTQPRNLRQL